jgi:hypothetical protein
MAEILKFDEEAFDELGSEVGFCLDNLRHPDCALKHAGRFYELASECLRAHAILRLLFDAKPAKFSNDLVMSGQARRAFLRRCRDSKYTDYFAVRSRTGSLFDALAGSDFELAQEISELSPSAFSAGDEYEDDFCYQHYLGLLVEGAPAPARVAALERLAEVAAGTPRLEVCAALEQRDPKAFAEAFEHLLSERTREISKDRAAAEELAVAIGTRIFIEGVAILKLAQHLKLEPGADYPMCPALAVKARKPVRPPDEFATP